MSESTFNNNPNGRKHRHLDFFVELDSQLLEQEAANAELHAIVEQNGTEKTEEDLAWEAFNKVFHK